MTEQEEFIYNTIIQAQKRFKKDWLARVVTEIITTKYDLLIKLK